MKKTLLSMPTVIRTIIGKVRLQPRRKLTDDHLHNPGAFGRCDRCFEVVVHPTKEQEQAEKKRWEKQQEAKALPERQDWSAHLKRLKRLFE
jgi:hypothetical protein